MNTFNFHCQRNYVKLNEIAEKVMQKKFLLKQIAENHLQMATGIAPLDNMLSSFEDGNLYVIAGRPGMGKTAFLVQIAVNIASFANRPVYILSLEESVEQLVSRMISQIVDIDFKDIISGALTHEQRELMAHCQSIMIQCQYISAIRQRPF